MCVRACACVCMQVYMYMYEYRYDYCVSFPSQVGGPCLGVDGVGRTFLRKMRALAREGVREL